MYFVIIGRMESHLISDSHKEEDFSTRQEESTCKRKLKVIAGGKQLGILACDFSTFFKVSERDSLLQNRLWNLKGVTDFSQKNF